MKFPRFIGSSICNSILSALLFLTICIFVLYYIQTPQSLFLGIHQKLYFFFQYCFCYHDSRTRNRTDCIGSWLWGTAEWTTFICEFTIMEKNDREVLKGRTQNPWGMLILREQQSATFTNDQCNTNHGVLLVSLCNQWSCSHWCLIYRSQLLKNNIFY